jgi:hypothetical protein
MKDTMMSDVMLLGVLRMPMDEPDPMTLHQFVNRARAAADRIEADAAEIGRMREALNIAAGALWRLSPASIEDDCDRAAAEHARAVGLAACESILKGSA